LSYSYDKEIDWIGQAASKSVINFERINPASEFADMSYGVVGGSKVNTV